MQIYHEEMIASLQALLRIKSVKSEPVDHMPFGKGIDDALTYMLELGESMGFKTKNIDHYAGYIEWGTGKEMLGILSHLDVVPEGEGWDHPPFEATLDNDRIYARGAMDDKGPTMAALYAMKALKDNGFSPKKRVRLILGTDEESGSQCMAYYLKKEEIPKLAFSPDADFPVIHGEMGIVKVTLEKPFIDKVPDGGLKILSIKGGTAPNMVPDFAEACVIETHPIASILKTYNETHGTNLVYIKEGDITRIQSIGISAHGSTPEKGLNAILQLIEFLSILEIEIGDMSSLIRFISKKIGMAHNGKALGIDFKDAYNKLINNVGMIDFDEHKGTLVLNLRYPISVKDKALRTKFDAALRGSGLHVVEWVSSPPLFFKPNHPLIKTLMAVYKEHTGDLEAKPITIGGGTYARTMPNAVAFGAMFPGSEDTMHQKNEYIMLEDYYKMAEIYASAIAELSK